MRNWSNVLEASVDTFEAIDMGSDRGHFDVQVRQPLAILYSEKT